MYIDTATFVVTNNCNLACDYCFTGPKNSKRMSIGVAKRTVEWLFRDDVSGPTNPFLIFFGGEPLLEFDLIQCIVAYAEKKARVVGKSVGFSATTNGTLVDDRVVDFCREHGLGLLLSLDGIEAAQNMHRRFRNGKETFRLIERNINRLLGIGFGNGVRMTITPGNVRYMMPSVRWLVERGFNYIAIFYDYYAKWTEEKLRCAEESYFQLGDFYAEKIELGQPLLIPSLDTHIKTNVATYGVAGESGLCGAALSQVAVGHTGTIFPCVHFATYNGFRGAVPIGSINEGLNESSCRTFARLRRKHLLGCDIPCDQCNIVERCNSVCPAVNYELTGNFALSLPTTRFFNIIWDDVGRSIVEYFARNPCPFFHSRYKMDHEKSGGEEGHTRCVCDYVPKVCK